MAVAGQVDELEVRVVPVPGSGSDAKGRERLPALVLGALEEAGRGPAELDEVELPVAGEVEELLPAAARARHGRWRRWRDQLRAARTSPVAQVRLVEPGVGLLGEDAGDALAVEVDPLVARAVEAEGRFSRLSGSTSWTRFVDHRLGVVELERRQRLLEVGAVGLAHVARLGDAA